MTPSPEGMNEPSPEGRASPEPVASGRPVQQSPRTHAHITDQKETNLRISPLHLVLPKILPLKGGPVFPLV